MSSVNKAFSPTDPFVSSYSKLCKNCKYYILPPPPHEKNKKLGKCGLFGTVNIIDGEIDYKYASDVRPALCDGKYFEEVYK